MNIRREVETIIIGKGTIDGDQITYDMTARIDSRTGEFNGTYVVDSGGDLVSNGLFRRLTKLGWDMHNFRKNIATVSKTVLMAIVLALLVSPAYAANDSGDDETHENACTKQQIEGGYADVNGKCVLTAHNWGANCPGQWDASVGEYGTGSCETTGCVTDFCDDGNYGGSGGGGGDGPDWLDLEDGWFQVDSIEDFIDDCLIAGGLASEQFWDGFVHATCDYDGIHYWCSFFNDGFTHCEAIPETPNPVPAPEPSTSMESPHTDDVTVEAGRPKLTAKSPAMAIKVQ